LDDRAISLAENWTGETEVQSKFLRLFGDFSQRAISRHKSGNSADFSKRYFQNCTASSSPTWSASKSLISQRECRRTQFTRHSRALATVFAKLRAALVALASASIDTARGNREATCFCKPGRYREKEAALHNSPDTEVHQPGQRHRRVQSCKTRRSEAIVAKIGTAGSTVHVPFARNPFCAALN